MKKKEVWILQNATSDNILGVYSSEDQVRRAMMQLVIIKQVVDPPNGSEDFSKPGGVVFKFVNEGFRLTKSWLEEEEEENSNVTAGIELPVDGFEVTPDLGQNGPF